VDISSKLKKVPLKSIKPYPNNPVIHDPDQIELIKQSIERNDYLNPIIMGKDNEIVAGHGRYYALMEIDPEMEIEVVDISYMEKEKANKYRILDNRSQQLSAWDNEKLEIELNNNYDNMQAEMDKIGNETGMDQKFLNEMHRENQEFNNGKGTHNIKYICPKCGWEF